MFVADTQMESVRLSMLLFSVFKCISKIKLLVLSRNRPVSCNLSTLTIRWNCSNGGDG